MATRPLTDKLFCVICSKAFLRLRPSKKRKRSYHGVRKSSCITCSKDCSRKYSSIAHRSYSSERRVCYGKT